MQPRLKHASISVQFALERIIGLYDATAAIHSMAFSKRCTDAQCSPDKGIHKKTAIIWRNAIYLPPCVVGKEHSGEIQSTEGYSSWRIWMENPVSFFVPVKVLILSTVAFGAEESANCMA